MSAVFHLDSDASPAKAELFMPAQPDLLRSNAALPRAAPAAGRDEAPRAAFQQEHAGRDWRILSVLVLSALLAMAIDVPLSRALVAGQALRSLHHFLESLEPFGQPPVVIAVALAVLL